MSVAICSHCEDVAELKTWITSAVARKQEVGVIGRKYDSIGRISASCYCIGLRRLDRKSEHRGRSLGWLAKTRLTSNRSFGTGQDLATA
jgi:hypothetical protein